MELVVVACPQSESELAVMQCALEARGVHFFAQGGGFGSLLPGPQIGSYNARRIMVPGVEAAVAKEALAPLLQPETEIEYHGPGFFNVLRMTGEFFLFGWFVPGKRKRRPAKFDDSSKRAR